MAAMGRPITRGGRDTVMSRESLERHQLWLYLAVISLGLALGLGSYLFERIQA